MNCIFCKIVNKEIPAEVVYEDKGTLAFLDVNPCSAGHAVVISKTHSQNILNLDDEKTKTLFLTVKKVTAIISERLCPDGFTIGVNHGRISGQAIDHLHVHVIPRYEGDGGGSIHSVVFNPPKKSLSEIRKLLTGR